MIPESQIREVYGETGSIRKTAAACGVSYTTIYRQFVHYGIERKKPDHRSMNGVMKFHKSGRHKDNPGFITYIDRRELVDGYNSKFGTNYKSMKSVLRHCYKRQKSIFRVGEVLGIAHTTVLNWMHGYGLELGPKGGKRGKKAW